MPTSDPKFDDFLKRAGRKSTSGGEDIAATPAGAAGEAAGGITGALQTVHDATESVDTGIKRGVAGLTGIPRAANAALGMVAPEFSAKLGDLAEQIPGMKRLEEFAAEPSANWGETLGYLGGLALTLGTGGGARGLSALANAARATRAGAATKAATAGATLPGKFYTGGIGFTPTKPLASAFPGGAARAAPATPAGASAAAPRMASSFPMRAGKTIAGGAAGGAVTDPENPLAGAAGGGVAAPVLGGAGAAIRSGPGQRFVEHVAGPGLYFTIAHQLTKFGINPAMAYAAAAAVTGGHWSPSPFGKAMQGFSKTAARKAGGGLRRVPPSATGAAAGAAENQLESP